MDNHTNKIKYVAWLALLLACFALGMCWTHAPVRAAAGDIFIQTGDVTVTNTTTETSLIGTGIGSTSVSGAYFTQGSVTRILLQGRLSTAALTPGTMRVRVKVGSTVIADTGAQNLTAGVSDGLFLAISFSTCRTTGASGTLMTQGLANIPSGLLSSGAWGMVNTGTQTVDTTVATQTFDVTVQFGTASASNSLTITNLGIRKEA